MTQKTKILTLHRQKKSNQEIAMAVGTSPAVVATTLHREKVKREGGVIPKKPKVKWVAIALPHYLALSQGGGDVTQNLGVILDDHFKGQS